MAAPRRTRLVQTVRLAGGAAGDAVEVESRFDWKPSTARPEGPMVAYRASFLVPGGWGRAVYGDEGGASPDGKPTFRNGEPSFRGWVDLPGGGGGGLGVLDPDGMASGRTAGCA